MVVGNCRKLLVGRIHGRWWLVFLGWLGCVLWLVGLRPDSPTFLGRPLARVTVALQAFHRHRWCIGACSPVFWCTPRYRRGIEDDSYSSIHREPQRLAHQHAPGGISGPRLRYVSG